MKNSLFRCSLVLFAVLLIFGGVAAQDSEPVVVQLNWLHDSSFAGFYMAMDEGYYAENGLDVELRLVFDEDGNFIDVIDEVVSGRAQFGIVDTATMLQARAEGIPIVAVAANFQRNPLAFVSLAESDILTPDDLVGKTVQVSEYNVFMLEALLDTYDIDPSEVNIVDRLDYSTYPLTSGDADVQDGWVTNEIAILTVQGVEFNAIYPFEYGIDMYPDVIFTSEEMVAEHPEIIQEFLESTLRGIQTAVDDTEAVVEHIITRDENLIPEELAEALTRAVPLFSPANNPPGMMEAEAWELAHEILLDTGILEDEIDIDAAYTLQFLDAIYAESE
jgi:NitT/TauT family transport system substrate-binding protein